MTVGHFLPLERTCEVLEDLCGASLSEGSLVLGQQVAAQRLLAFEHQLKTALQQEKVLYADETGSKVSGKLHWIHVVSSNLLTLYAHHQGRGVESVKHMGVLPEFKGILMHDAWGMYFKLPAEHALCNAHLLRELKGLALEEQQNWAGELRSDLQQIYHQHKEGVLTEQVKQAFKARFNVLVEQGLKVNPAKEPRAGIRGRVKQSAGRNLALRLQKHQRAVLRLLEDPEIPFDNNQAERDIRMICVKRKVSGGVRSEGGGEGFCRIRSYLSTLRKQGLNALLDLISIFQCRLLLPQFSC
ncbi:transposase [Deinococcus cellulosilyticus NBRC 106333 = KACC 11606]|uniref:Transposase n=1 Tax=Deinococcus cellulosilyticus (strain DSM 18568 / NBRC 106333 / KACC 11606 / 5516J-15) TaxID=1223518 RepID=A0A511N1S7_DEIC1|nr:IS66 family transposase [Deinococcus cellulosilyticus]GEM46812.1 transposase [Deinococcus cellulosilyticus NBRC 106333 = KACC 11606]